MNLDCKELGIQPSCVRSPCVISKENMRRQSERIHEHSFNLEFSRILLLKDFMHDAKLGSPSGPSEPVGQGVGFGRYFDPISIGGGG